MGKKKPFKQLPLPGMPRPRDLMTPEARWPRGYTPERQQQIRNEFAGYAGRRPIEVHSILRGTGHILDKEPVENLENLEWNEKHRDLRSYMNDDVRYSATDLRQDSPEGLISDDSEHPDAGYGFSPVGSPYATRRPYGYVVNDPQNISRVVDAVARTTIPVDLLRTVRKFFVHDGDIPGEKSRVAGVHWDQEYPTSDGGEERLSGITLRREALNRNNPTLAHELGHAALQGIKNRQSRLDKTEEDAALGKPYTKDGNWPRSVSELVRGEDEGIADRFALDHRGKIFKHAGGKKLDRTTIDMPSGYPLGALGAQMEEKMGNDQVENPLGLKYTGAERDWSSGYFKGLNASTEEMDKIKSILDRMPYSGDEAMHYRKLNGYFKEAYDSHKPQQQQLDFSDGGFGVFDDRGSWDDNPFAELENKKRELMQSPYIADTEKKTKEMGLGRRPRG